MKKTSNKVKKYQIKELIDYLLTESNIRFTIYLSYLIYYVVYNILSFQDSIALNDFPYANSILQSFLTFLAFDSLIEIVNKSEFSAQLLLKKILTSMISIGSLKDEAESSNLEDKN